MTTETLEAKESSEQPSQCQENTTPSLSEWRIKRLGGRRNAEDYTLEKLKETPIMSQAIRLLKTLKIETDNVFIHGPVGSGKTHLAISVAQKFYTALVVKPTQMLREMRSVTAQEEKAVLNGYIETKVLVIDDIGIQKDTEFASTVLYEVIDGRYANRQGGLIVTSNLSLGDLAVKIGDDRIASRLAQMCRIISLAGAQDYRVRRTAQEQGS